MVWNEGSATLMGGAAHHISPTRDPTCSSGNSVCTSAAFDAGKAIIVDTACENNAANMGDLVHYTCPVQLDTAEVTESVTGATIPGALKVAARLRCPSTPRGSLCSGATACSGDIDSPDVSMDRTNLQPGGEGQPWRDDNVHVLLLYQDLDEHGGPAPYFGRHSDAHPISRETTDM